MIFVAEMATQPSVGGSSSSGTDWCSEQEPRLLKMQDSNQLSNGLKQSGGKWRTKWVKTLKLGTAAETPEHKNETEIKCHCTV